MQVDSREDGGAPTRMELNNSSHALLRLDVNAHPLEYVNDGRVHSFWLSTALQEVSLTIDFGDVFQVHGPPHIIC